jgi:hypothetical protein
MSRRCRSRAASALAVGLAALTLAACGSSSASPSQVRSQATSICSRANRQIGRIPTPSSAAGALAFVNSGIAVLKPEVRSLRQLSVTGDAADVWNTAIRALSDQLATLQGTASKIRGGADAVQSFKSLQQTLAPLETQADNAWHALQIPACQSQ